MPEKIDSKSKEPLDKSNIANCNTLDLSEENCARMDRENLEFGDSGAIGAVTESIMPVGSLGSF